MKYTHPETFSAINCGMPDMTPAQRGLLTSQVGSILMMLGNLLTSTPTLQESDASNTGPYLVKLGKKLVSGNIREA